MKKNPLRVTAAFFLCLLAGLSFISGVLPFLAATALGVPSFEVLMQADRFTRHVAAAWAICGGILGWLGGPKPGTLILGSCGLASGVFLGFVAFDGVPSLVAVSAAAGTVYGGSAGFLLGKVFPRDGRASRP